MSTAAGETADGRTGDRRSFSSVQLYNGPDCFSMFHGLSHGLSYELSHELSHGPRDH